MIWLLYSWLVLVALMLVTWGVYLYLNNPAIIDVVWAIAIATVGWIALLTTSMNLAQIIALLLLSIWCLRLAGYLFFTRAMKGKLDKRYQRISEGWQYSKHLGYALNYQLQAILAWVIAMPFWWIRFETAINGFLILGAVLIMIGIIGEHVADMQLYRFKNKKGVCNIGLWRYSRHPNYFFEWLVWLGFACMALPGHWGLLALLSPVLLLIIMLMVTGPITEQESIKSRGQAYKKYQKSTSMFLPLPPKLTAKFKE